MKIGRTVPPAAAPLTWSDLGHGIAALFSPTRSLQALEEEVRRHFGVDHVFLVSSGTAALALTLMALKSKSSRTEVVIPAYTCFAVPAAVLEAGLKPVVCDIDPWTFDYDHSMLGRTLNAHTLCVVAHHLFGAPSNVDTIRTLCRDRGVSVVEDAAQAMGVRCGTRHLGTVGDAGIFSLGRGKNITCGSGGIIVTSSSELAHAIARIYRRIQAPSIAETLKDFAQLVFMSVFIRPSLYWIPASLPFLRLGETIFPEQVRLRRLSAMKAGLLRGWQSRLSRANRIRSEAVTYFSERLPGSAAHGQATPFLRLPILAKTRAEQERLYRTSRARGLGLALAYPTSVSEIPQVRKASPMNRRPFPAACKVAERLVTLPTHELLTETDKTAIADLCCNAAIVS